MESVPVLEVRNVQKRFGRLEVLRGVDLRIGPREVVGLIGDNGAGKSTLLKVIAAVHRPDSGEVLVEGRKVSMSRPIDARRLGIEMVYQDFMLAPNLSVCDNIFLGRDITTWGPLAKLDRRRMMQGAQEVLERLGFQLPLKTRVSELSGGQRQIVAIARALLHDPKLILFDEPTASLSVSAIGRIQELITTLRNEGRSCIYVSHRLPDVLEVADRVVVLRAGRVVAERYKGRTDLEELVRLMMGIGLGQG